MATLIKSDGTEVSVEPENGTDFSLSELQGHVGGYVQVVAIGDNQLLACNEEGLLERLPVNMAANIKYGRLVNGDLVGDILIFDETQIT